MKTIETTQASAPLAEYVRDVNTGPVVLTVRGKPVAALVAIKNIDLETLSLSTNPDFLALIQRSRARQKSEGGISSAEMRRRLGLRSKR